MESIIKVDQQRLKQPKTETVSLILDMILDMISSGKDVDTFISDVLLFLNDIYNQASFRDGEDLYEFIQYCCKKFLVRNTYTPLLDLKWSKEYTDALYIDKPEYNERV